MEVLKVKKDTSASKLALKIATLKGEDIEVRAIGTQAVFKMIKAFCILNSEGVSFSFGELREGVGDGKIKPISAFIRKKEK